MAKCPTPNCGETLSVHSRRAYCPKCRAHMNRWSKRKAGEILIYAKKLTRNVFRVEHISDRKLDQMQAAAQHPSNTIKRR